MSKPVDFLIIVKDCGVHQRSHPTRSRGLPTLPQGGCLWGALRSVRDRISVPPLLTEHTYTSLHLWCPTFSTNKRTTNWTMSAWIHHSLVFSFQDFHFVGRLTQPLPTISGNGKEENRFSQVSLAVCFHKWHWRRRCSQWMSSESGKQQAAC